MNYPNFPLYTSLRRDDFKELSNEQKDELIETIKKMNDEQHSILFALMCAYHLEHDNHIQDLPYNGKVLKSGHKFDLDSIPSKLQAILYNFSKVNR